MTNQSRAEARIFGTTEVGIKCFRLPAQWRAGQSRFATGYRCRCGYCPLNSDLREWYSRWMPEDECNACNSFGKLVPTSSRIGVSLHRREWPDSGDETCLQDDVAARSLQAGSASSWLAAV